MDKHIDPLADWPTFEFSERDSTTNLDFASTFPNPAATFPDDSVVPPVLTAQPEAAAVKNETRELLLKISSRLDRVEGLVSCVDGQVQRKAALVEQMQASINRLHELMQEVHGSVAQAHEAVRGAAGTVDQVHANTARMHDTLQRLKAGMGTFSKMLLDILRPLSELVRARTYSGAKF